MPQSIAAVRLRARRAPATPLRVCSPDGRCRLMPDGQIVLPMWDEQQDGLSQLSRSEQRDWMYVLTRCEQHVVVCQLSRSEQ